MMRVAFPCPVHMFMNDTFRCKLRDTCTRGVAGVWVSRVNTCKLGRDTSPGRPGLVLVVSVIVKCP